MKSKVLYVLEATEGGIRKHVVDLLEQVDRCRFDVGLVYSLRRADPTFLEDLGRLRTRGIQLLEVPMVREVSPRNDAVALLGIIRIVRREQPGLLHLHGAKAGMLGRMAMGFVRPRPAVVYTPHGGSFHDVYGPLRNRLFAWLESLALPVTDTVINVSDYSTRVFIEKTRAPRRKLVTIHNGVAPPPTLPAWQGEKVRVALAIPTDAFMLSMVGLMNANKGHEVLLESLALARHRSDGTHIVCVMVGDGPLREHLERRTRDMGLNTLVRFVGYRTDAHRFVHASDALVLPSTAEVFGLTLVEAMFLGKPVIASAVGGIPEIVDDGLTGLLVPPRDPARLADAILQLANRAELRATLGLQARRRAARFSLSRMVSQTELVYERLLDRGAPRSRRLEC